MTRLTILHTNDLHGRVHKLPHIASLTQKIRQEMESTGGFCTLWDAGDAEDPTLFVSRMTKGSAVLAILRRTGYDLAALGNATPIRYGPQAVQGLSEAFGQPLLCANMVDRVSKQPVPGTVPFVLQSYGAVKVGVIGMTAELQGYSFFHVCLLDPVPLLRRLVAQLRGSGAHAVILLSHLGSEVDRQIAGQVAGIDAIIGGHDHKAFDPPLVVNGTLIAQAGEYGMHLGRLDLEFDPVYGKVHHLDGTLIPIHDEVPQDESILQAIEMEQQRVEHLIQREIGVLRGPLDWAEDQPCAAGSLLADALLERVPGAEIALALAGHWNDGLAAGPLSIASLYNAVRSTANPARAVLTGAQVYHFLAEAFKPENASRRPRPLRGVAVGLPHVARLRVHVDPVRREVLAAWVGTQPLQPDRQYVVATTDLELSREVIGYLDIPDTDYELEVPTIVPEILQQYIARHSPLPAPAGVRLSFHQS